MARKWTGRLAAAAHNVAAKTSGLLEAPKQLLASGRWVSAVMAVMLGVGAAIAARIFRRVAS